MYEDPPPSRRKSPRKKTLKEAKVVLRDWSTIDCLLRNLGEDGARLDFSDPVTLPETFSVLIVSTNALTPAKRVWMRGKSAGIQFTGPEKQAPPRKL